MIFLFLSLVHMNKNNKNNETGDHGEFMVSGVHIKSSTEAFIIMIMVSMVP